MKINYATSSFPTKSSKKADLDKKYFLEYNQCLDEASKQSEFLQNLFVDTDYADAYQAYFEVHKHLIELASGKFSYKEKPQLLADLKTAVDHAKKNQEKMQKMCDRIHRKKGKK